MTSEPGARSGLDPAAVAVRAELRAQCAAHARWLTVVGEVAAGWESRWVEEEQGRSALLPRPLRYTPEQIRSLVVDELCAVTGQTRWAVERVVHKAEFLARAPEVMDALATGLLDADRVTYLVRATALLSPAAAAAVVHTVLAVDVARVRGLGIAPADAGVWDLAGPQAWRQRVSRTVARAQQDDADGTAVVVPSVYVRIEDATHADLVFTGTAEDVLALKRRLEDLAAALSTDLTGPDGRVLRADEREAVALVAACGNGYTGVESSAPTGRRELGIVLHADTLFGDGPAANDPGEVRGTGTPTPVPAQDARRLAHTALEAGASTCLLLADTHGRLVRLLRIGTAPPGGWTRHLLVTAGRAALARAPALHTAGHDPTVAVDEHVRAAHPVSVAPGTGAATHSASSRVDLDHRVPYPGGSTTPQNVQPLHRTPHRHKTTGRWHCRTSPDGHGVTWTTLTGVRWTHEAEPLPGHADGEGYAPLP